MQVGSRSFLEVLVWQKAHAWVLSVYRLSAQFPRHELFGLTAQLRRAAVSVPANFAEGFKRRSRLEKIRFYNVAQASIEECRYYLILARDLKYADTNALRTQLDEVGRMMAGYIRGIEN